MMCEVYDIASAKIGDLYMDTNNQLWRVTNVVYEPTVTVEQVEGTLYDPNRPQIFPPIIQGAIGLHGQLGTFAAEIRKMSRSHFIGDQVWNGWKRIWRKPAAPETT